MSAQTDLYDALLQDVLELTKRPDLMEESQIALRTATLSIHGRASFPRDLVTSLVKLPNPAYQVALDIQALFPRLRGLNAVRVVDVNFAPIDTDVGKIEVVEPNDIYDPEYGSVKNNIAYVAGTSINIRTAIEAYGYIVSYYQLPLVRREEYNSWIAQMSPDAIIYQAASIVFSTNGNEEKAASYQKMVREMLFPELVTNFLTGEMR